MSRYLKKQAAKSRPRQPFALPTVRLVHPDSMEAERMEAAKKPKEPPTHVTDPQRQ